MSIFKLSGTIWSLQIFCNCQVTDVRRCGYLEHLESILLQIQISLYIINSLYKYLGSIIWYEKTLNLAYFKKFECCSQRNEKLWCQGKKNPPQALKQYAIEVYFYLLDFRTISWKGKTIQHWKYQTCNSSPHFCCLCFFSAALLQDKKKC